MKKISKKRWKMLRGWKVLLAVKGTLTSIVENSNWASVRYQRNVWTLPNPGQGPLCVFDDPEAAWFFAEQKIGTSADLIRVARCDYVKSRCHRVWRADRVKRPRHGCSRPLRDLPICTVLASKVNISGRPLSYNEFGKQIKKIREAKWHYQQH